LIDHQILEWFGSDLSTVKVVFQDAEITKLEPSSIASAAPEIEIGRCEAVVAPRFRQRRDGCHRNSVSVMVRELLKSGDCENNIILPADRQSPTGRGQ
jgi:hypothetical protein